MRILSQNRLKTEQIASSGRARRRRSVDDHAMVTGAERAIVAVEPIAEVHGASTAAFTRYRPNAPFLAHLIAHHEDMPQTRARRRAPANHALDAYARTERAPRHLEAGRVVLVDR